MEPKYGDRMRDQRWMRWLGASKFILSAPINISSKQAIQFDINNIEFVIQCKIQNIYSTILLGPSTQTHGIYVVLTVDRNTFELSLVVVVVVVVVVVAVVLVAVVVVVVIVVVVVVAVVAVVVVEVVVVGGVVVVKVVAVVVVVVVTGSQSS